MPSPLSSPAKQDVKKLQEQVSQLEQTVSRLRGCEDAICSPPTRKQLSRMQQALDSEALQQKLPFSGATSTKAWREPEQPSPEEQRTGWTLNLGKRLRRLTVNGRERVDCKFRVTRQRITLSVFKGGPRDEDDAGMWDSEA